MGIKEIAIFGATGSIGESTLKIIDQHRENFSVKILTAHKNYAKLIKLAKKYQPQYIAISDSKYYQILKTELSDPNIKIFAGKSGLDEISQIDTDITIAAIMGIAGLSSTLKSIKNTKILAIANKEPLVCAGKLIKAECKKHNTKIIPLDSEHNSIFQLLNGTNTNDEIDKIILTASGGPFLSRDLEDFKNITIEDALNHPNWKMGNKITIDSATMMNKALEMIEAQTLFNLPHHKIDVIIHPESIIHAFINYIDGSVKSLLGKHDMRINIAHALAYPQRIAQPELNFDISEFAQLNFYKPDLEKFRAIILAKEILKSGGIMPIIFNSANEVYVNLFLENKIKFIDIVKNIDIILGKFPNREIENLEDIFAIDNETRKFILG